MPLLLDSNVLIDVLRGIEPAKRFVASVTDTPSCSVVTLSELISGARSRREEQAIALLEVRLSFLPVDTGIAKRAGQFIKHYQASHGLDDLDALIAATAEEHKLELATLNVKHFPMFPKLKRAY
jgi:predicted nucleic acid-binding protein